MVQRRAGAAALVRTIAVVAAAGCAAPTPRRVPKADRDVVVAGVPPPERATNAESDPGARADAAWRCWFDGRNGCDEARATVADLRRRDRDARQSFSVRWPYSSLSDDRSRFVYVTSSRSTVLVDRASRALIAFVPKSFTESGADDILECTGAHDDLWDLARGKRFRGSANVYEYRRAGRWLVPHLVGTAARERVPVELVDASTFALERRVELSVAGDSSDQFYVDPSPDGELLADMRSGRARIWRTSDGSLALDRPGESLAFAPDGKSLFLVHGETLERMAVATWATLATRRFDKIADEPRGPKLAALPDGSGVVALWEFSYAVFEARTLRPLITPRHVGAVADVEAERMALPQHDAVVWFRPASRRALVISRKSDWKTAFEFGRAGARPIAVEIVDSERDALRAHYQAEFDALEAALAERLCLAGAFLFPRDLCDEPSP